MKRRISYLFVILLCIISVGCGKKENKDPLIGQWETKFAGYSYVYTFNEDKTCSYDAAGTLMKCTYEIDEDKISILYEGDTNPFETTFSIDGDKLNVKDSIGQDTIYNRK